MGDLYVKLNVKFPDTIPPHLIPGLESALDARVPAKTYDAKKIHVDEVELSEPSEREKKQMPGGPDSMDEDDDDDGEGGQPGVQCAQRTFSLSPSFSQPPFSFGPWCLPAPRRAEISAR
jgi:DnaJ family protein A protein 2